MMLTSSVSSQTRQFSHKAGTRSARASVLARSCPQGTGKACLASFTCRYALWEITLILKCLAIWEPYIFSLRQPSLIGRREAHRWGHELSASRHSIPCPLGRSETRAKSGPNRALPELRGGEFPENGASREGRLGRRCHGPRPRGRAWRMPPSPELGTDSRPAK